MVRRKKNGIHISVMVGATSHHFPILLDPYNWSIKEIKCVFALLNCTTKSHYLNGVLVFKSWFKGGEESLISHHLKSKYQNGNDWTDYKTLSKIDKKKFQIDLTELYIYEYTHIHMIDWFIAKLLIRGIRDVKMASSAQFTATSNSIFINCKMKMQAFHLFSLISSSSILA